MKEQIADIALNVRDYDEAISFYTKQLNFSLVKDYEVDQEKRWVMVSPPGATNYCLLLTKGATKSQQATVVDQSSERTFLALYTRDFWSDYHKLIKRKVNFVKPPTTYEYGTCALFQDLDGNLWELVEST